MKSIVQVYNLQPEVCWYNDDTYSFIKIPKAQIPSLCDLLAL